LLNADGLDAATDAFAVGRGGGADLAARDFLSGVSQGSILEGAPQALGLSGRGTGAVRATLAQHPTFGRGGGLPDVILSLHDGPVQGWSIEAAADLVVAGALAAVGGGRAARRF